MRRTIIGLVVLAVLGIGGYFGYTNFIQTEEEPETEINVDDIELSTEIDAVTAEGRVVPLDSFDLSFQVGGVVSEILVEEGATVTAGTELIILEDIDQQLALSQAEASLAQAEANVTSAEAAKTSAIASMEAAKAGVLVAEAQLALVSADPTDEQIALSESQVAQAEAAIVQAQGQLQLAAEGATQAQIAAAQADLEAARASRLPLDTQVSQIEWFGIELSDNAQRTLDLQVAAANADIAAKQKILDDLLAGARSSNINAASQGVTAAEANVSVAEAQFDLLLAGSREEQIEIARTGVAQAENSVVEAEVSVESAEASLNQAITAVEEARKGVEAAELAITKTRLTAPVDGIVSMIQPKVGELALAGTPVAIIADFSRWQVETTDLTELGIVSVVPGLPVEITIDAFPGESIQGVVTDISSTSELVLGDVTYDVTIDLEEGHGFDLHWGMTAFVRVDIN